MIGDGARAATRPLPLEAARVQAATLPLAEEALALRRDIVHALYTTGGGHYGGCLSVIDLLLTLYRHTLRVDPRVPRDPARDRLILSKGHAALALYAVLRRLEFFDQPLASYADFASLLEGHPDMLTVPGVDFSTGSLGQGLSVAVGMAHALRHSGQRVWVVLGDGECQEGQVWEAAMLAGMCGLGNLHVMLDHNRCQEWGWELPDGSSAAPILQTVEKWAAFGWRVMECDGHDFASLQAAIDWSCAGTALPSVVIAQTTKGHGVSLCEADPKRFHCDAATLEEHIRMLGDLA